MPNPPESALIRHLRPRSFLSFGPSFPGIELQGLNVTHWSKRERKSNLLEAINLLRAAPKEWREVTRKGGWSGRVDLERRKKERQSIY